MLLLGRCGTMAPLRSPMLVVLGKPLVVPRHDDPPDELVGANQQVMTRGVLTACIH